MSPPLEQAPSGIDGYDDLPASIRGSITPKEWLWLSDLDKATLVRQETEPEWTE